MIRTLRGSVPILARSVLATNSRLDGSPLVYNNADPYLPDLLVCPPSLAEPSLEILRRSPG